MDYRIRTLLFCLVLQISLIAVSEAQLSGIRDFIHLNIVGVPVIHDDTKWDFDPDVALKRRPFWEDVHGRKGEKLIERLGLGIDGKGVERLAQQRARDQGHLGGLNYFLP